MPGFGDGKILAGGKNIIPHWEWSFPTEPKKQQTCKKIIFVRELGFGFGNVRTIFLDKFAKIGL